MPLSSKRSKQKADGHGLALLTEWANTPAEALNQQDNQGQALCYQFSGLNLPQQRRAITNIDPTVLPMI